MNLGITYCFPGADRLQQANHRRLGGPPQSTFFDLLFSINLTHLSSSHKSHSSPSAIDGFQLSLKSNSPVSQPSFPFLQTTTMTSPFITTKKFGMLFRASRYTMSEWGCFGTGTVISPREPVGVEAAFRRTTSLHLLYGAFDQR
jgi:hypothetical protein